MYAVYDMNKMNNLYNVFKINIYVQKNGRIHEKLSIVYNVHMIIYSTINCIYDTKIIYTYIMYIYIYIYWFYLI